jgi:hypothetical protein
MSWFNKVLALFLATTSARCYPNKCNVQKQDKKQNKTKQNADMIPGSADNNNR